MFTRARIAAGSAVAGALLVGAVASSGLARSAEPAYAAWFDTAEQQVLQAQPQPSPQPGPRGPRQGRESLTPEQKEQRRAQMQQRREQWTNRLAANLGVSPERVTQAFRQTRIDMINQAVQDGRLTRERADQIIQRINSGQADRPGASGGRRGQQ